MRRLLLFFLAAVACFAAAEHRILGSYGARYVYRGYSSWTMIRHFWSPSLFTFTVDPETDLVTAPGHDLTNGAAVYVTSSGTLPSMIGSRRQYWVCSVSGDTFKLVPAGNYTCSHVATEYVNFTDAGSGTHKLGTELTNGVTDGHVTITLSGLPAGVTCEIWCEHVLCPLLKGIPYTWGGGSYFVLKFTASPTATLGLATITATLDAAWEEDKTIDFPLTVETLAPIASARPASYPSIPTLETWQSTMPNLARTWCDPTSYATAASSIGSLGYGLESQVWFYDGGWAYRQIAQYTGNANWNNCADYISGWYRDYTLQMAGGHTGYKAFTDGLKSGCASCDMRNRIAIVKMAGTQGDALRGGWPWDRTARETAYLLDTYVNYGRVTGTPYPKLVRAAENLLAMFDELFRDDSFGFQHIYWDGLAMRALIQYFELTGDQRVPVAIKTALDWIWANAWNDTTKKMAYNPSNKGPRCESSCADSSDGWDFTELINLTVPAAGWYYWYSGDDTYRQRGDEWFKALPRWPSFSATASDDRLTITVHGLAVDDRINVKTSPGYSLPGGLVNNGNYWVNGVIDENTFTLSTTQGGATLNITSDGTGFAGLKCISSTCRGRDSGKMFSQQFRWGIAYVQWRQGQTPYAP